jgi:hypothetical protein
VNARRVIAISLGLAALGLVALIVGLSVDPTRAWYAYLDAWLFGVSVAAGALLVTMVGHASKAGWMVMTRRPMESVAVTLPVFALLFVPIAFGLDRLYPWTAPSAAIAAADPALAHALEHKHVWLNKPFFLARSVFYFAVFCAVSGLLRAWSRENDVRPSAALVRRMRRLSGGGLPLVGLTLTWASFDWSMSLQPAWSSTMYGIYFFAGSFVAAIGLACVMLGVASARARDKHAVHLSPDHAQALGRLLFAMVIFWAYIAYGQLVVYWMGDIPDEVTFYLRRTTGSWTALTYALVVGHFVLPFFALLNRRLKRHPDVLVIAGAWIFAMHYGDVYWQVLPVHDEAGIRPHWLDLGAVLFVGGLSCAWVISRYGHASPLPLHVPELADGLDYEAAV